jgi:hypothetical protein
VNAKEAWFQEGYRAGYSDGFTQGLKLNSSTSGVAARPGPRAKVDNREQRLKGFPCAVCGCASYSDEAKCPCCGTAKSSDAARSDNRSESAFAGD